MFVKYDRWLVFYFIGLITLSWGSCGFAKTIEVEEDSESLSASPTPVAVSPAQKTQKTTAKSITTKTKPVLNNNDTLEASPSGSLTARVRAGDNISFYYFTKAGFVANQPSQIPSIGKIVGDLSENETSGSGDISYSMAKKPYVEISSKVELKKGDLLVVYQFGPDKLNEPRSNFTGFLVENNAIVKVSSAQKKYCEIEIVKSFTPFHAGDHVKYYSDELQRWRKAQTKKSMPNKEVRCFVAGGDPQKSGYSQTDFIVLTAGSNNGVVEGQTFQICQPVRNSGISDELHVPRGMARVFYAGPNYSMAQILSSHEAIQKGFEAIYRP